MKKIGILLVMMLMSVSTFAQQAQKIIDDCRGKDNIQVVDMDKNMLSLASALAKTDAEKQLMKSAESISMAIISDENAVGDIQKKLDGLTEYGYGSTKVSQEEVDANVFVKTDGETVTEAISLIYAKGYHVLSLVKGKFSVEQLAALIKQ